MEEKIKTVLEDVKIFLQMEGGDIEFIKYEDNIVYVKLLGHCSSCPMRNYTLKMQIEEVLISEIPEIKEVINIS